MQLLWRDPNPLQRRRKSVGKIVRWSRGGGWFGSRAAIEPQMSHFKNQYDISVILDAASAAEGDSPISVGDLDSPQTNPCLC
jgi:hypothetical protein